MIFQIITILLIAGLIIYTIVRTKSFSPGWTSIYGMKELNFRAALSHFKEISFVKPASFAAARKALNAAAALLFIIMSVSGIIIPLIIGAHVTGILLFIHVLTAPLFTIVFTLAVLFWAQKLQFNKSNLDYLRNKKEGPARLDFIRKVSFWLFATSALISSASILLAMFPLTDTVGQQDLLNIHRYSALVMIIIIVYYRLNKYLTLKS